MEFLLSYWWIILIAIAALVVVGYLLYVFIKMPTVEQLNTLKEWLLYAVAKAEKELGSGTGQIKLRYVYDMFVGKFPALAKVVCFEDFSILVDEVLEKFRILLDQNASLKEYIDKE